MFTLDCREIDAGCASADVSTQASAHLATGLATALALFISPFVVARAVRFADDWRGLRLPSLVFGCLTIVAAIVGSAVGEGLGQYAMVIVWLSWLSILAMRMHRLARASREHPAASQPGMS